MAETQELSPERKALLEKLLKTKIVKTGQATEIENKSITAIPRRRIFSPAILSFSQQRLWIIHQLVPDIPFYNLPSTQRIIGNLNIPVFEQCLDEIVRRHESLRTVFAKSGPGNEEPAQVILPGLKIKINYIDLSGLSSADQEPEILAHAGEEAMTPFDLEKGPLLRARLLRLGENDHALLFTMHHITADTWSQEIFVKELGALYTAFSMGNPSPLPELPIQYADFAIWQRQWLQGETLEKQLTYWKKQLGHDTPVLELPVDRQRPAIQTFQGGMQPVDIPVQLSEKIITLVRTAKCTLFMLLLAAFNVLLYRYSGQEDILIGSPIANRRRIELESLIGFFANTLVFRTDLSGNCSFIELVERVRKVTSGAYDHQDLPFEKLVEEFQPDRYMSHTPLFQVMFVLQNTPKQAVKTPAAGITVAPLPLVHNKTSKFDLWLSISQWGNELGGLMEYNTDIFDHSTITRLIEHFKNVLTAIAANPGQSIADFEILSEEEKQQILVDWNDTHRDYPIRCLHDMFAEQAERTPDYIALHGCMIAWMHDCMDAWMDGEVARNVSLTYQQLNEQSDRLAGLLIEKGVLPDNIVAIMLERSIEMVIGILGILKSGGAYLPIDPEYPQERIEFMLKDSNGKILLVNKSEIRNPKLETNPNDQKINDQNKKQYFGAAQVLNFENLNLNSIKGCPRRGLQHSAFIAQHSNHLAYVIYTSGSTGKPKGVMIENRSVINFIKGITGIIPFQESDRILSLTTISFDIFGLETILPLIEGSTVILGREEEQRDAVIGAYAIAREAITIFQATPSRLKLFIQDPEAARNLKQLKYLLVGGEIFPGTLLAKVQQLTGAQIYNVYGPTETTIWSTIKEVSGNNIINIGKPLANTFIYILNRGGLLQPIGVPGEICISGDGIARGYLNNPELTRKKFGPQITLITQINRIQKTKINKSFGKSRNPFSKGFLAAGGILYCTGDLGRWLNDGNIEFLGRIDHQVKIRGFRIELGEIETLLLKHGQVKDAVVVLKEDDTGDTYLAAYFVSGQEIPGLELREFLAKDLPDYMVPSYFMQLEKLPLNPSGKVDRKALPGPQLKAQTQYTPPVDELEKQLVKIWAEVLIGKNDNLAANPIGRYDNFFMAGGHSLKAMRLAASIHKQFNVKIPVAELFKSPTIEAMARFIRDASIDANALIEPGEKKDFYQTSPAQAIVYIIQQMKPTSTAYNMPVIFDINGFIRTEPIENAFRKLIARHEGLRTFFQLIEGKPVQRICQEIDFKIAKKAGINFDHFISAFDLAKAPLLRVILLKIEEEKHILVIDMHHIISDGISQSVLVKDFLAVYRGMPLPPLTIQYKDFSEWQRKQLSGDFFKKQEEYWLNRLKDPIPVLNLPTDYPRPDVQSFKGQTINSRIGETLTNQMKVIAAEQGATLYMILLAIYTVLLSKYANQNDFIIGSPAAGRRHADLEPIVGMFINVILMRNPIHSKITFTHFLDQVKDNALQAFDNQDYPIDHLAGKLGIKRDESRNPLYEIIFALVDSENTEFSIPGLAVNPVKYEVENTKTDLRLGISEKNNEIITTLTYAASLFKRKTVENMLAHYVEIIEQVAADKNIKIGDIKISHHLTTLNSNIFKEDHDEFNF